MHKVPFEAYRGFLSLLRVGLWEDIVKVNGDGLEDIDLPVTINYDEILHFAQVQSVVGLVAAGIEVSGCKIPLTSKLKYTGLCLQIEQRNVAMNQLIANLVKRLHSAETNVVLVKGQGLAKCYTRPLLRSCGDVDLFFDEKGYRKAIDCITPIASWVGKENPFNRHLATTIDEWSVELHGTLRGLLKRRLDKVVDEVQDDTFSNNRVRLWHNGSVDVPLPVAENDVIFIFSHNLQHFFKETVSLRQICDWCRLLWSYRDEINRDLLEKRLRKMRVMSEWKVFASLAVNHMGMPVEAMPLYSPSKYWSRKGNRILSGILNNDNGRVINFHLPLEFLNRKANSFWQHTKAGLQHFVLFPLDTIAVWINMVVVGLMVVVKNSK